MPHYKNTSKFYKRLTIDGKRINVPPNGVFYANADLDLNIYDYLELTKESATIQNVVPQRGEKTIIHNIQPEKVELIEKAIIALNEKLNQNTSIDKIKDIVTKIMDETPKIEQEEIDRMAQEVVNLKTTLQRIPAAEIIDRINKIEENIKTEVMRRQDILKRAIDEVNNAVIQMEEYIYNERENNMMPIVVVEDEKEQIKSPEKNTGPSLEDIIRGM